jgi:chromosome segregation ATPase
MVCSMIKKGVVGAALGAGTLFLVFGTSAPSYVKTAFHKVRQNVKESVDPQFEIDRARQDIENLKPMFDQNKETLARAEVEAENLESEVGTMQANLDKSKQTILSMQHKLKTGDFRLTGHIVDTADSIKADLAERLDHYDYTADTLKQKREVLKAKQQIIRAAHEQLSNLRQQKTTLLAKLANIEAKLRVLEAKQTKNEFNFDDGSTLSRAKQTISDLEKRLSVMSHRAEIDGRYGDLDSPSSYVDPRRDVVKEVEDKFGESSQSAVKAGDKSL